MRKFTFTLERVRQWREKQLAVEEARLQQLFSEKALVEQRRAVLEQEGRESAALVTHATSVQSTELRALDAFRRYAVRQRLAIAAQMADCDRRIVEQQGKLMEARRKSELLARLKDRKLKTWNAELAREVEAQAGESFLAKWNRVQH